MKDMSEEVCIKLDGLNATLETVSLIVKVEIGRIVRVFSKITETEYIATDGDSDHDDFSMGLIYVEEGLSEESKSSGAIGIAAVEGGKLILKRKVYGFDALPDISVEQMDPMTLEYRACSADGAMEMMLSFTIDPATGDILVTQTGRGSQKGLAGIRLGLCSVTCCGDLLLPFRNGIKACRENTSSYGFESKEGDWPTAWALPLALFDDPEGGLWFHTKDDRRRYKRFSYDYAGENVWNIALDSYNDAPFDDHTSVEGLTWRINGYEGEWTVPVQDYKHWFSGAFNIADKKTCRPDWTKDIQLAIRGVDYVEKDEVGPLLDTLAEHIEPGKVLLSLENWKGEGEFRDVGLPNYEAGKFGAMFNAEARKRGFRTMYFANYHAIDENHELFEQFLPYTVKDPLTDEHHGFNLKGEYEEMDYHVRLYYVNPAYKPWRDLVIGQFKQLFETNPADALFIDQTFVMFNDGNGRIDGMTQVEGNEALHRELSEALPGIAIGGEGINEISFQYESFCELHPLGMVRASNEETGWHGWGVDPGALDRMVPVVPEFLLPECQPIGYVAFPNSRNPHYKGWRDALRAYRGITTVARPSLEELEDPNSELRCVLSTLGK